MGNTSQITTIWFCFRPCSLQLSPLPPRELVLCHGELTGGCLCVYVQTKSVLMLTRLGTHLEAWCFLLCIMSAVQRIYPGPQPLCLSFVLCRQWMRIQGKCCLGMISKCLGFGMFVHVFLLGKHYTNICALNVDYILEYVESSESDFTSVYDTLFIMLGAFCLSECEPSCALLWQTSWRCP